MHRDANVDLGGNIEEAITFYADTHHRGPVEDRSGVHQMSKIADSTARG